MEVTGGFDPVTDLIAADFERPGHVQAVNLRTLTPFQRALLVIDGTVTKFIEAYTMEPVDVGLVDQKAEVLSVEHPLLQAAPDTEIIARRVLLKGKYSYAVHAYASSLIVPGRLRKQEQDKLQIPGESIGRILLNSRMEQHRELIWYGKEYPAELPAGLESFAERGFLSRTYRIISGGQPLMLINEKFPLDDDRMPVHH